MKKKLYIHVGNFKTGSTLIQKFLFLNKKFLNKKNIGTIYEKQNFFKYNINNYLLFKYFEKLDEKKIFEYLKKNKFKHLIVSSEYFSTLSLDKKKIRFIKDAVHKLGYQPKIIFFYRRGFSYFYSFYTELLKQKKILKKKDGIFDYLYKLNRYGYYFFNKNDHYFLSHNYYFNNDVIKRNWKQVFKKDLILIKFNKKEKNKFLYEFINFLGLNKFDLEIPKAQNQSKIKFWHIKRIFNFLIIYFYYFLKLKKKFE